MSKKHRRAGAKAKRHARSSAQSVSGNVIWRQSAEEATLASKPRYNGFACGHGAHGSAKYSRNEQKRAFRKDLRSQLGTYQDKKGASRGSFLYVLCSCPSSPIPLR